MNQENESKVALKDACTLELEYYCGYPKYNLQLTFILNLTKGIIVKTAFLLL